jgi:hypothetical protein
LEGSKSHNVTESQLEPKFPQNLRPISLLSTTGKLFEKLILNIVQKHIEERSLLNASQLSFRACYSTTLQYMRLTDQVTLNLNDNMSTVALFLGIEKAVDTTWHSGLLYKLRKLESLSTLIKLIGSFLSQHKFSVLIEGEMSTPRKIRAGVPQGSVLVWLSEKSSLVSVQWGPGVSAEILKLVKI